MTYLNFDIVCATCNSEYDREFEPDEKGIVSEWFYCPECDDKIHFGYDTNPKTKGELGLEELEKMGYKTE